MTSDDDLNPERASGSRWEPTEAAQSEAGQSDAPSERATAVDQEATKARWRPSRSLSIAAAAALAGLVVGGVGGWAAGTGGHPEDHRLPPGMAGFHHGFGDRDGDGRMPGGPGGIPGGPGGPGVMPGQPQLGQGSESDDGAGDGQQS